MIVSKEMARKAMGFKVSERDGYVHPRRYSVEVNAELAEKIESESQITGQPRRIIFERALEAYFNVSGGL